MPTVDTIDGFDGHSPSNYDQQAISSGTYHDAGTLLFYGFNTRLDLAVGKKCRLAMHEGRFAPYRRVYTSGTVLWESSFRATAPAPVPWLGHGISYGQNMVYEAYIVALWSEYTINDQSDPHFGINYAKIRFQSGIASRSATADRGYQACDLVVSTGTCIEGTPPPDLTEWAMPDEIEVDPSDTVSNTATAFINVTGLGWAPTP
jgi:hypothetical protein